MTVLARILTVALLASLSVAVTGGSAHASVLDAECAGTQTIGYTPGLTLVPMEQQVTVHTAYAPCASLSAGALSAGESAAIVRQTVSCLDALQAGSATRTITWNTGDTSTFSYNRTVSHVGGNTVSTLTGTITAGLFAGAAAEEVIVGPTLDILDCLTPPGITSRFGTTVLTINQI